MSRLPAENRIRASDTSRVPVEMALRDLAIGAAVTHNVARRVGNPNDGFFSGRGQGRPPRGDEMIISYRPVIR